MKNLLEYIPFLIISKIVQLIGFNRLRVPSKILTYVFYDLLKIRREVVLKNLSKAFPEKKSNEIEKIARSCYNHFSTLLLEIMCIPKMKRKEIIDAVECDEIALLRSEYNKRKGLVFLTAHFGNWELGAISVPAQMGVKMYPIVKPQRNPYVTRWLNRMREKHGNEEISLGMSIRKIYQVIKNGELLGVVGDQRGPKEGKRVNLFGQETAIYGGTAELVVKNKTPLYVFFVPKINNQYKAYALKISLDDLPENQDEMINEINQRYANLLESYVRQYPEQWFWMHNIWKY